jgi:hypothetical protein
LRHASKKHQQTVCLSQSILKHLTTAQGTQILILVLLFFELQSEMQVAQCETEKFFNLSSTAQPTSSFIYCLSLDILCEAPLQTQTISYDNQHKGQMYQNRIGILQKTPNISVDLNSN